MPTISFNYGDFQKLLGKKMALKQFEELAALYAKAEVEGYDGKTGEVRVELDDTNLPYLWCVEGLARLFRGATGKQKGLQKTNALKSNYRIIVDKSVRKIRPYIATFVAEGKLIDENLLEQLIQLQEKFCEGYGRKRQKVSIGLYSHKKIKFPVHYKAAEPDSVSFAPLEMSGKLTLAQILEKHPKGKQYGWILKDFDRYPLLVDSNNEVLSLVPIINSNLTGKLVVGDSEMLFEATGTDFESVNLAANIFAQNLQERGFRIFEVVVEDGSKKMKMPFSFNEKIKLKKEDVKALTGLEMPESRIRQLLEKAGYGVSGSTVSVPDYRRDVLHEFDVIEDIAIMHGFNNIESSPMKSYTTGSSLEMAKFADRAREIAIGLGFQEIMSPILSNKEILYEKMNAEDSGTIELENPMSETYAAVRSWLIPIMMEVLSKNKHVDYPQKIFEQGIASARKNSKIKENEKIAFAISHSKADFTEMKQALDAVMSSVGVKYTTEEIEHGSFVKGRSGEIKVNGRQVAIIGEISPEVLAKWGLEMPVAALEINLSELMKTI